MLLSVILPELFIALVFLILPFAGAQRFFSISVAPEWLAGKQARNMQRDYQIAVALVAGLSVMAALYFQVRPAVILALPLLEAAGLTAAWAWGWNSTLPFRLKHSVTRTAALGPQPTARIARIWSVAALLPIIGTAMVLLSRYQTIPASFAIHFSADRVPDHVVLRTWLSVFGPLLIGCFVVLLLTELLRGIQRHGAGIADKGAYSALTGRYVVGVAWLVALECSAAGLSPLMRHPGSYAVHLGLFSAVGALVLLLITTGVLIRNKSVLISGQSATNETHWKGGVLYFNREDAALFVPKRLGFGWTLNMAQPAAWLLMGLVLAIALVPLALRNL